ncbi:transposase [Fulvivirga sp. M361]|nr:transposase [Fulvivirga sp. M361]
MFTLMSRKYKIRDQEKLYFVTFAVVYWIDVFTRRTYREIFMDSLRFCQKNKGLELYAYCLMSNHVHLIIGTNGENKIQNLLRDLKKYTSVKIIEAIKTHYGESRKEWMLWMFEQAGRRNSNNKRYQFWQQHNHPIELDTNELMTQKLNYIHNNPVKAGIVLPDLVVG